MRLASHTPFASCWPNLCSRLKPGDVVEVIYPAHQPNKGVVNIWDEFWPPPLFFGLMMLAFLVAFRLVLNGTIRFWDPARIFQLFLS